MMPLDPLQNEISRRECNNAKRQVENEITISKGNNHRPCLLQKPIPNAREEAGFGGGGGWVKMATQNTKIIGCILIFPRWLQIGESQILCILKGLGSRYKSCH